MRNAYRSCVGELEVRGHLEYLGVGEMVGIKLAVK
jgi:hypothetical protein